MKKRVITKTLSRLISFCMASVILLTAIPPLEAEADYNLPYDLLTATDIRLVVSNENAFYQENDNRYVIGPGGWVDFYVTIQEKFYIGMGRESKEGETHVYRYTPNQQGYLDIDSFINSNVDGQIFWKKDLQGNETRYYASGVDLSRLGSLPKIYHRNELPKVVTIYPGYSEVYENNVSKGVKVDKFVISIKEDPVMYSSDFEIKYRFQAMDYVEETDWTVCNDMNYINIPEDKRNEYMQLFLEIRDKLGLYYYYTPSWGPRGTEMVCRITMSSDKVIQGGDGLHMYLETEDQGFKNMLYNSLRSSFLSEESYHEVPRRYYGEQQPIAVFLNTHPNIANAGYTRTREDIDIEKCGYQWSKNPTGPDPERPFIPFTTYHPAVESHSYYNLPVEGYWCEVTDRGSDLTEDGTYYLYIRAADAVSGGVDWFPVIYDGNKYTYTIGNIDPQHLGQIKLIKDTAPLEITISEPQFTTADYDIDIEVTDNHKLLAAQYHICDNPSCSSTEKACENDWIDISLSEDSKSAVAIVNTGDIFSSSNKEKFTVHVRAVEARYTTPDPDPFAYEEFISGKSRDFYVPRSNASPLLKMGYFGEVTEQGKLAAAKEYEFHFYGHPEGGIFPGTDYYYENRNVIGDIYYALIPLAEEGISEPQWTRLDGHELHLSGDELDISGDYILKAYVEDPWNNLKSEECVYQLDFSDPGGDGPVITASLDTYLPSRENVEVTLGSNMPVLMSVIDEAGETVYGSVYGENHAFEIGENGRYSVEYETNDGFTGKKDLFIGNIDRHFSTSFFERDGRILYLPQEATRDNVTAYLFVGEKMLPLDDGITWQNGWISYNFENNGSFTFKVMDQKGIIHDFTASVTAIDKIPPQVTLEGQLVYPLYQGLDFDFTEPGYSAEDNLEGDITDKVQVTNNVNVYEGGYYEIQYTVADEAGNTVTEVRSVPVYKLSNINLLINGTGIRGGATLAKGGLAFQVAGLKSERFVLKYLPGKHKPGVFKDQGIEIKDKMLTVNEEGWYTFYVMDEEMTLPVSNIS